MTRKNDPQYTKLTADLLLVTRGFCDYGEAQGLLTPDGLKLAVTKRKEIVKELADAGKSQRQIASLVGVGQQQVSRDLNGRKPTPKASKPTPKASDPEPWTDEEIEAEIGTKIATPEQNVVQDFLGLASVAMRVETLDLSRVKPTSKMRTAAIAVVKLWTRISEGLNG